MGMFIKGNNYFIGFVFFGSKWIVVSCVACRDARRQFNVQDQQQGRSFLVRPKASALGRSRVEAERRELSWVELEMLIYSRSLI